MIDVFHTEQKLLVYFFMTNICYDWKTMETEVRACHFVVLCIVVLCIAHATSWHAQYTELH